MQFDQLELREFIKLLDDFTVARPLVARAQQGGRIQRDGMLGDPSRHGG